MRIANTLFILLFSLSVVALLGADEGELSNLKVEEVYLQGNAKTRSIQIEIINEQADSKSMELKEAALHSIEEMINTRPPNREEQDLVADVLGDIGLLGTGIKVYPDRNAAKNIMEIRKEAARLLGELGGESSAVVLCKMLECDDNPLVLAQCARSGAKVIQTLENPTTMDTQLVQRISKTMQVQLNAKEEGHYALGFIDAIYSLAAFNPQLVENSFLIRQIVDITDTSNGYNKRVRDEAWKVLKVIQN